MKASQNALARILMLSSGVLAAGCVPSPDSTPTPAPTPVQTAPTPAPTPVAVSPAPENWIDAPRTPGTWVYSDLQADKIAAYGERSSVPTVPSPPPRFTMTCLANSKQIRLSLPQTATGDVLTIRTESASRSLRLTQAVQQNGARSMPYADLSARDPILDAMAITRGRFAVESEGMPSLYLPPWAEVTRVIEACR